MPFLFFAFQWAFSFLIEPFVWTFLYPAVFLSSWLGGLAAGLRATLISMALVWAVFFWPPHPFEQAAPGRYFVSTGVFCVTSVLFSIFHGKLRRANQRAVESLEKARAATEEMRTMGEKFQQLLENAVDGIFVADLEGRYTDVNRAGCDLLGRSREEIIGKTIVDFLPPEEVEKLWQSKEQMLAGGDHVAEWRLRRKDGTYVPVEVSAKIFADGRWQGFVRDITKRRAAEEALQRHLEEQERFARSWEQLYQQSRLQAAVTAHLSEGVVLIRVEDSTIVYTNPRFEEMFQVGPGELLGEHISLVNAPGDVHPEETAARIIARLNLEGVWHGEIENIRKDGARFWCYASVSRFDHPEFGAVWIAVHTDITERKRLEEASLASLREKEILLREIHHRVKNNLQVISSLFYLQRERVQDDKLKGLLDESRSRVESIALIHEQLYQQSTSFAAIDFNAYLQRLSASLRSTYGAGQIDIAIDAAGVTLDIERAVSCGLLVSELLSNALKHAFPGRAGEIRVRGYREGRRGIVLEVADDGAGIPESFDWRHAPSLGLLLVQSLARQLGGSIELDRSSGTRFVVRFDLPGG